jgi:hypothetical protein
MGTNLTLTEKELKQLLLTVYKVRCSMFDVVEVKLDKRSLSKPVNYNPTWKGKRGTFPLLEDLDKALAILRLHVNSEEAVSLYDAMGVFDQPIKKKVNNLKAEL